MQQVPNYYPPSLVLSALLRGQELSTPTTVGKFQCGSRRWADPVLVFWDFFVFGIFRRDEYAEWTGAQGVPRVEIFALLIGVNKSKFYRLRVSR